MSLGTRSLSLGLAAAFVLAAAAAPLALDAGALRLATEIVLLISMAQAWNLLAGYNGLISMGHQAFIAVGAYACFYLSNRFGVNGFLLLPVAALAGAAIAGLVAPLLFRLRDAYFAIGTWVVAEIGYLFVAQTDALGGAGGLPLTGGGTIDLDATAALSFWLSAALCLVVSAGLLWTMRSAFGLALQCVRDNEIAAASLGVNIWRNRFIAFVASAAICGTAGALHFLAGLYVEPVAAFDANWIVAIMFIVIIGGVGTLEGPWIGAAVYFALRESLSFLLPEAGSWHLVALGGLAMVVMLLAPKGLWAVLSARWGWRGISIRRQPPMAS